MAKRKTPPAKGLTRPHGKTNVGPHLQKGFTTMANTQTATDTKPKNGAKAAETAAPETTTTAPDAEGTSKRRGVVPTMPMGMVYSLPGGRVAAGVFHPADGTSYVEQGKGIGSAKGALEDSGFVLGALTLEGPEWLADLLPADCALLGYCSIKGFPLPKR